MKREVRDQRGLVVDKGVNLGSGWVRNVTLAVEQSFGVEVSCQDDPELGGEIEKKLDGGRGLDGRVVFLLARDGDNIGFYS